MKQIQHFFLEETLTGDQVVLRDKALLHQLKNVLRLRTGDSLVLLNNQGDKVQARIDSLYSKEAILNLGDRSHCPAPVRRLRLFIALSKKPATLEWIVEKATELGVTDIVPMNTERAQVHELRKVDRLKFIIKEAAEQCERFFLPELHEIQTLSQVLESLPSGHFLAGDPWTYDSKLADVHFKGTEDVNILIGPEGGLTVDELEAVRRAGGILFQLGENILRMETAVIATLSLVQFGRLI